MTNIVRDQPWGLQVLESAICKCCRHRNCNRIAWHQGSILVLTYLAYTCYHMTRKPISVVKNIWVLNCSGLIPPQNILIDSENKNTWCDWAPFGKYKFTIKNNYFEKNNLKMIFIRENHV